MSLISVSNVRIFCQNNYVEVLETGKLFINIENFLSIVMFVILQSETFISSVSPTQRKCVLKILFFSGVSEAVRIQVVAGECLQER